MITLIPIEPLSPSHGVLIVAAFSRLLIDGGGQPDGHGDGGGFGFGGGYGWGYGSGDRGDGWGDGNGGTIPDEWRVE
jgi:hypothetical protein